MNTVSIFYGNGEMHESEVKNIDGFIHYLKACKNAYGDNINAIVYLKKEGENTNNA